jgi:putative flippase GtrA
MATGRGSVGRYGVIGVTGVAIDFITFSLLIRAGMVPVLATTISTLAGITNNYTWNSLLNFRLKLSGRRGAKFLTVGLIGLATSAGLLQLLITLGLDPITAKWVSIPVVVGGQVLANKLWSFSQIYR